MKTIKHSLKLITQIDENEPTIQYFLKLDKKEQIELLNQMMKALLIPKLEELNKNGSWASVRVRD